MRPTKREVKQYMRQELSDHIDKLTGEINCTSLVEDAWWHFHPEPEAIDIDEYWFDWAQEIEIAYELRNDE
jgi:hypothetical protein